REHRRLARAEPGLALALEDGRHAGAGLLLDRPVAIGQPQVEVFGQAAADAAFAGAGRPDQDEVGGGVHAADCRATVPPRSGFLTPAALALAPPVAAAPGPLEG